MYHSKAISYLHSFTRTEWQSFLAMLPSLNASKYKDISPLIQYLESLYPNWEEQTLEKQVYFKKAYPKKKYDDKLVRYQLSYLKGYIEQFLVIQSVLKNKLLYQAQLEQEVLERKLFHQYSAIHEKSKEELAKSPIRDAEYYYQAYQYELLQLSYHSMTHTRNEKNNIEQVLKNLDSFYLAKKLQIASEVINIRNILSTDYTMFMLDEIMSYLSHHAYNETPVIQVYLLIIRTLQDPDEEAHYLQLEQVLKTYMSQFTRKELYEIYQYLQNYCIKKINLGAIAYQQKLFENYQTQMENDILIYSGQISQWDYKNIVTIALRMQAYDWAENFIMKYKNYIPEEHKENAYSYNYANVLFRKGNYDKSLKLLQQVNMTDVYYKLDARSMLLKTYYELNEYATLQYHAQAFKKFLRRDNIISPYQKEIYSNMISYVMKMQQAKGTKSKIKKIQKEIEQATKTADIAWLKESVKRL